jgi:copper chaperone CopZ
MQQLNLAITGMHCGACVRRVTMALEKIQGVQIGSVEVGSARLEYDPAQADPTAIMASIEKIGFSATKG